jgi:hypothetical protein
MPIEAGSVADPDPGSGAFFTPGSGYGKSFFPGPGSQIQPKNLSNNFVGSKYL